jgi:hypothetical protein
VWLPGNYFIRGATSPIKNTTWSALGDNPWCLNYVAATTRVAQGQFHDAHEQYSEAVLKLLNKIAAILSIHECSHCKPDKINPPFRIKGRLYALSQYFKSQLTSPPAAWKRPWFCSDRWREGAFSGGQPNPDFVAVYNAAQLIKPANTLVS